MSKLSPLHELTERAGAIFADDAGWSRPRHYGDVLAEYNQARSAAAAFDVSNRGKIQVAGKDAASFLHNFCTNDILGMPLGAGCEAFFCNPKAKVIAHALIYHVLLGPDRHAFWLDTAPGQSSKLVEHLNRYLIAEDVEIADRTE